MALYRTKPEEVEAIQYAGSQSEPFGPNVPAWVWSGISNGHLLFTPHGITITYNGLTEPALPSDWLILPEDGVIRVSDDKTFKRYYAPARKRMMSKTEAVDADPVQVATEVVMSDAAAAAANAALTASPAVVISAVAASSGPDEFEAALSAIGQVGTVEVAQ